MSLNRDRTEKGTLNPLIINTRDTKVSLNQIESIAKEIQERIDLILWYPGEEIGAVILPNCIIQAALQKGWKLRTEAMNWLRYIYRGRNNILSGKKTLKEAIDYIRVIRLYNEIISKPLIEKTIDRFNATIDILMTKHGASTYLKDVQEYQSDKENTKESEVA